MSAGRVVRLDLSGCGGPAEVGLAGGGPAEVGLGRGWFMPADVGWVRGWSG